MRWLVATVLALTVSTAPAADQDGSWLTGQFLVATEQIGGPPFVHTVIFMIVHDENGAMGLIVNRPLGELPFARVLDSLGRDPTGASGDLRAHFGGPVQPTRAFVLHSPEYMGPRSRLIREGIALTADLEVLDAMAHGRGPKRSMFILGYAGWRPASSKTRSAAARGSLCRPTRRCSSTRTTLASGSARRRARRSSSERRAAGAG